jgi:hypothetical protein
MKQKKKRIWKYFVNLLGNKKLNFLKQKLINIKNLIKNLSIYSDMDKILNYKNER